MTLLVPALLDGPNTDANVLRQMIQLLASGAQGVSNDTDLKVTAGSGMVSNLAAGKGLVNGTQNLVSQGAMTVLNDATVSQTHAAADGTNPRNDLVGIKVEDAFYAGSNRQATPVIITGTPAASPADPATPANWLPSARVRVNAGASSLGTITDLRPKIGLPHRARATALTGTVLGASTFTKITLGTETYDPGANFDAATNYRFVAPISGYYDIKGRVGWTVAPTAGSLVISAIYVNGVEVNRAVAHTNGTGPIGLVVADDLYLAAGSYVELWGYSGTGTTTAGASADASFLAVSFRSL